MKFLSTRELRNRPGAIRELARKEDLVLTANGRPFALLLPIAEDDLEEMTRVVRQARALMAVSRMRRAAAERGLDKMSMRQINTIIGEVRSKRR